MSRRVVLWIVGAIVLVNVVLLVVDHVLPGPSGEPNSALATTPQGFAAWAALAERNGIEVIVLREGDPPPDATVVDRRFIDRDDVRRLQNARLADGDNAAYALELVMKSPPAPLVFVERERARGLAALPEAGKWALGLLGAAALLFMLARGRRFGPPDPPGRVLAPPRVAYVDALAAALAKTRDPAGAMEPITRELEAEPPRTDEDALALAREYAEAQR